MTTNREMAKFNIYKLHFTTPVHLGDNREDYGISLETIQSDTLYAALISCLAKIGATIPENGDLGCNISSLFPFYQADSKSKPVYFFPRPLKWEPPRFEKVKDAKKVKKTAWLDREYFELALKGDLNFENESIENHIQGRYLTRAKINADFIVSQITPRVTISRTGKEDAVPFYMDRIHFQDKSGLYFLAQGNTELLERALNLLQHEGIGTDRNVGNGYFFIEKDTLELKTPSNSTAAFSLAIYIPESEEQIIEMTDGANVAYDFTRRGGWITTPPHNTIRKNVVYAFTPASVFNLTLTEPVVMGKIVDLNPNINFENVSKIEHPIWRNGKSIFLPIKI